MARVRNASVVPKGARAEKFAKLAAVLAHPLRLNIISLLGEAESSRRLLEERCRAAAASLRHHLAVLRAAGLLACHRRGRDYVWALTDTGLLSWLDRGRRLSSAD